MSVSPNRTPTMEAPGFDPGLTQKYTGDLKRIINKDGRFNVRHTGGTWRDSHPYLFLISTSWLNFFLLVSATFTAINTVFTFLYMAVGAQHVRTSADVTIPGTFLRVFFFSAHTLTTVGYGNMYPDGVAANIVSALEALVGLMAFAIATGLLFGRFSKPSARLGFSETMVIAPYMGGTSLQFRVANRRSNNLIDVEARILLMTVELCRSGQERKYTPLALERAQVIFFPLPWTVVHPIREDSPLYGKTAEDLKRLQAEVMIVVKGFDDTFGQTVHARYSYRYDEIVWGARFEMAFEVGGEGDLVVSLEKIGSIQPLPQPD
jgi:inward rectifier potassium channel